MIELAKLQRHTHMFSILQFLFYESEFHESNKFILNLCVCSFSSVKFPGENPHFLHHPSSTPCLPPLQSAPLPADNGSSSTLSERPSVQRFTAGQSTESHCPLRGVRTYSRINKNIQSESASVCFVRFVRCCCSGKFCPLTVCLLGFNMLHISFCIIKKLYAISYHLAWILLSVLLLLTHVCIFLHTEKECEQNKHDRVLDHERKKLCSREVMCNVKCSLLYTGVGDCIF